MSHLERDYTIHTGADPRAFPEFTLLRDEMAKLSHPARPDVDWQRAEQLALNLFRQNGVELQTAAWYTLARTQSAGLPGLCEGLSVIHALLSHQWVALWPLQIPARIDILAWLTQRLQQNLRTLVLNNDDLPTIYQAEQLLSALCSLLQSLELKHLSKLEALRLFMHNAAIRLEKTEADTNHKPTPIMDGEESAANNPVSPVPLSPLVYIAQNENVPDQRRIRIATPTPRWKAHHGFIAGIITMALFTALGVWLSTLFTDNPVQDRLLASVRPLPAPLDTPALANLRDDHGDALAKARPAIIKASQQQLNTLQTLPPLWILHYGDTLLRQAHFLWPNAPEVKALSKQWDTQREANALPANHLNNWHLAQTRLQTLIQRLNSLDEQRGRYITVSELKSAVYSIQQPLQQTPPLEEMLRQLQAQPDNHTAANLRQQIDERFKQLMNRYATINKTD